MGNIKNIFDEYNDICKGIFCPSCENKLENNDNDLLLCYECGYSEISDTPDLDRIDEVNNQEK